MYMCMLQSLRHYIIIILYNLPEKSLLDSRPRSPEVMIAGTMGAIMNRWPDCLIERQSSIKKLGVS